MQRDIKKSPSYKFIGGPAPAPPTLPVIRVVLLHTDYRGMWPNTFPTPLYDHLFKTGNYGGTILNNLWRIKDVPMYQLQGLHPRIQTSRRIVTRKILVIKSLNLIRSIVIATFPVVRHRRQLFPTSLQSWRFTKRSSIRKKFFLRPLGDLRTLQCPRLKSAWILPVYVSHHWESKIP